MTADGNGYKRWQKFTSHAVSVVALIVGKLFIEDPEMFKIYAYAIGGLYITFVGGNSVSKFAKGGGSNGG